MSHIISKMIYCYCVNFSQNSVNNRLNLDEENLLLLRNSTLTTFYMRSMIYRRKTLKLTLSDYFGFISHGLTGIISPDVSPTSVVGIF